MVLSKAEIEAILKAKRRAEEALERTRHLVDPESVRTVLERTKDLVDPPAFRMLHEQHELTRALAEPEASCLMREHEALVSTFEPAAFRALTEAQAQTQRLLDQVAGSLVAANDSIARSVFAADFVTVLRELPQATSPARPSSRSPSPRLRSTSNQMSCSRTWRGSLIS